MQKLVLENVRVHNLKSISLELDPGTFTCFTGVSGSGKSSLAFDTIYVEGQRRYVESLSQHARRFIGELPKPDVEAVSGITPTISIEQKTAGRNPRSTVGTITEIYDYMRVLWARVGSPHCPISGEAVCSRSREEILDEAARMAERLGQGSRLIVLSPHARAKKGEFKDDLEMIARKGFTRVRIDGNIVGVDEPLALDKAQEHDLDIVVDRLVLEPSGRTRLLESVTYALELSQGTVILQVPDTGQEQLLSQLAYSPKSGRSYPPLDPHDFSFNSPIGMCERCHGMGWVHEFDLEKIIDEKKSIAEGCCLVQSPYNTVRYGNIYDNLARIYHFDVHTPWHALSAEAKQLFLRGTEKKWTHMFFVHPETGATWQDRVQWRGVLFDAYQRYQVATSERYRQKMEQLMHFGICPSCHGERIKPYPAACLFHGKRIADVTRMTVIESLAFFEQLHLHDAEAMIAQDLVNEITSRLSFLSNVGLEYMQLDRTSPTLSGGEAQRVRLASQIGSGLVGVTYILDEPSIGLHPQDNSKLIHSLETLRDRGNSVIVVEHDEETICAADTVVDFGPRAGVHGGEIVFQGTVPDLMRCKESLTGAYLARRRSIPIPSRRKKTNKGWVRLEGATHHNLKGIDVDIPLGCFVAVTGVSGSGKSSLFLETLYPALARLLDASDRHVGAFTRLEGAEQIEKVIEIDQSPIGRTPRSNPATYVKVFDAIRRLFTQLPEAASRGYKPGRFSFNVQEGSCSECRGMGMVKIDMDFLEDAYVECPLCHGMRFDQETLEIRYKGKNIQEVLDMGVAEALEHFANIPAIERPLRTLADVGLDYIKLGQSSTTLSGGEAQRIKLARELTRPSSGHTLYILDEPTTGMHFYDLEHLLNVLQRLVANGNSVLTIEHNMDLVKCADWVIEMGPGSGPAGGNIIATGTPEAISKVAVPTAPALARALSGSHPPIAEKRPPFTPANAIQVYGARQNNLKGIDVTVPRGQLTAITGPSGSGKSSFAFETLFAEGQRRYAESLSPYVRQFVKQMPKAKVGDVNNLSPAVAIEQRVHATNPRSTVGTMTEIYDYLRLLWARVGIPHCPKTGTRIQTIHKEYVVERLLSYPRDEKLLIMAPIAIPRSEPLLAFCSRLQKRGFSRLRLNGSMIDLDQDPPPEIDPKQKHELMLIVDRLKVDARAKTRMLEAVGRAAELGQQKVVVMREQGDILFNLAFAVEETGESYPEITSQTFMFNRPEGMCPDCLGLGFQWGVDFGLLPGVQQLSIYDLITLLWGKSYPASLWKVAELVLRAHSIDPSVRFSDLKDEPRRIFLNGSKVGVPCKIDGITVELAWSGLNEAMAMRLKIHEDMGDEETPPLPEEWADAIRESSCPSCQGSRLNPLARHVTIENESIASFCKKSLDDAVRFLETCDTPPELAEVMEELKGRLHFLVRTGLAYLSLDRRAGTLSGGEAQRVRLARQIGSGLTGLLYVLDEPTIGLHPQDTELLTESLDHLKQLGNTLVVVEHDPQIIECADRIIEFGPGAGKAGGAIVAEGTPSEIRANPRSLTATYLDGEDVPPSKKRKRQDAVLTLEKVSVNNLRSIDLDIPLGTFTCLTGVSGSGKSSLLEGVLRDGILAALAKRADVMQERQFTLKGASHFTQLFMIDQKPIGHTTRSDVSTYVDLLTPLRSFFAALPEAKIKGLQPKHFSTYHMKGMCTGCWGLGYKKVPMYFLPPVKVPCPLCKGLRLQPLSLSVQYKGKNLGELLLMTVDEVKLLFDNHPRIKRLFDMLCALGLGYLALGQEVQTLSGGESQRLKLAKELVKHTSGHSLYLLDEPTTGLHGQEVKTLLAIMRKLVDQGHTVIAIEHNLDFIRACDHVIDLGPGAGAAGGRVVFSGAPEKLAQCRKSATGKFLRKRFGKLTHERNG